MKNWKNECLIRFLQKKYFWVIKNWQKKTDMSGIKAADKNIPCWKWSRKKRKSFYEKMLVWIKEERDSVTRPKSENVEKNEKWKNRIRLKMRLFLFLSSKFHRA